jgi:hypothetical protein
MTTKTTLEYRTPEPSNQYQKQNLLLFFLKKAPLEVDILHHPASNLRVMLQLQTTEERSHHSHQYFTLVNSLYIQTLVDSTLQDSQHKESRNLQ